MLHYLGNLKTKISHILFTGIIALLPAACATNQPAEVAEKDRAKPKAIINKPIAKQVPPTGTVSKQAKKQALQTIEKKPANKQEKLQAPRINKEKAAPAKKKVDTPKVAVQKLTAAPQPKPKAKPKAKPKPKPIIAKEKPKADKVVKQKTSPAEASQQKKIVSPVVVDSVEETNIELPAFSLESLPLNLNNWVVDKPPYSENRCTLKSKPVSIKDGAGGTTVTVVVDESRVTILTKSDIDLSYDNTGVVIGSDTFGYDAINKDTNAYIENNVHRLIDKMKANDSAEIVLGFWPTWPQTNTYTANLDISKAALALKALDHCNTLLK